MSDTSLGSQPHVTRDMIAIRSRVDAPACTERSHLSRDWLSIRGAIVGVHGSTSGIRRSSRSNRHWMRDTSSSSRIDSRGIVLRYERTLPRQRIRFLPRLYVGTVSQPSSAASLSTSVWVGPTNVAPRSTGTSAIVVVYDRPPTLSRPSSTTTSCPSLVKARAVDSPAKPAPTTTTSVIAPVWPLRCIRVSRSLTYHIPEHLGWRYAAGPRRGVLHGCERGRRSIRRTHHRRGHLRHWRGLPHPREESTAHVHPA